MYGDVCEEFRIKACEDKDKRKHGDEENEPFKILPRKGSLEAEIFPKLAKNKSLHTVKFKNVLWHSIDSFKDIELSSQEINSKKYLQNIVKMLMTILSKVSTKKLTRIITTIK